MTARRPTTWLASLALVALIAAGCGGTDTSDAGAAKPSAGPVEAALGPLAGLEAVGGGSPAAQGLVERPTVVWFWAPWCPNCRAMAPEIAAVAAQYDDRVSFLGVAGRGEPSEMDAFIASTGTGALAHVVDDDGSAWAAYGVVNQPALAYVGLDGKVEVVSGVQRRDAIEQRLLDLLDP